ncbi:OstA-like protein [Zunongwangia sp.]|uniref:OstA-like protein n=1 Tax=Zunongwangia sp. TaxID=1965325 RepID=UPI003AA7EE06
MKKCTFFLVLFFLGFSSLQAQENTTIKHEEDRSSKDPDYPGALIMSKVSKQVHFIHQGIDVWCDNAVFYENENFFKAYGNVRMKQGDTVSMKSNYAEYNGDTQFAFASGQVKMQRPNTTLETDTLFFDRLKDEAYYRSGGKIIDTASVLTSQIGRYYLKDDKYSFNTDVTITNPKYIVHSNQMDFYSETGNAYMYGPSTIESETTTIYCERGFYDTRGDTGYFVKNSKIDYNNRTVKGDSLYFDRSKNFASATNNIRVIDTANQSVVSGHYAEVYREKDSVIITKWPLASSLQQNDSLFISSDTLLITGKPENRVIRGFYDVRLFKADMSGKSDSIYVDQKEGITKLININNTPVKPTSISKPGRKPVIWSGLNQMTGDTIKIISNTETEQIDSLLVYKNAFLINKDTIEGYNQIKGQELIGHFKDNEIYRTDIDKNTETLYYSRSEDGELIGISKTLSSRIEIFFKDRDIEDVYYYQNVDGNLKPKDQFPKPERELSGFNWRGEEQLTKKQDLFLGKEKPKLKKIEGIKLPEEQDKFFGDPENSKQLLNPNSRLQAEDLKDASRKDTDTLKVQEDTKKVMDTISDQNSKTIKSNPKN